MPINFRLKSQLWRKSSAPGFIGVLLPVQGSAGSKLITGSTVLINAAGARDEEGIDVDFAWAPADTVTIRGGVELMSGHYTSFQDAPFFQPLVGANGRPLGGNSRKALAMRPTSIP